MKVLFLDEMQDIFQDRNSTFNSIFNEKSQSNLNLDKILGFGGDATLLNLLRYLIKMFDVLAILVFFIGMIYLIWSNLGNSSEAKWKGANTLVNVYAMIIFVHMLMTMFCSHSNLSGGRLTAFLAMFFGEITLMGGSIALFALGAVFKEIYIMTGQENYKRRSMTAFNSMTWILAGSGIAVLIAEVL